MEGSSLVLEKNDSEEMSGDIVFHVIVDILFGIYCHYADVKIKINIKKSLHTISSFSEQ